MDNDGDGVIDAADPACHTDGDAGSGGAGEPGSTYDPNIDTEDDLEIDANPGVIRSGNSSTVTWLATGSPQSCSVSGPGVSSTSLSGSQGTGSLTEESTYTITCTYETYSRSASARVLILPSFEEF